MSTWPHNTFVLIKVKHVNYNNSWTDNVISDYWLDPPQVLITSLSMHDHAHLKSHYQFEALIDLYLHAKKINFIPPMVFEIISLNILQSLHFRFLHLTQEPDFSQTCGFKRIMKVIMVHDLNPKNLYINGLFFGKIQENLFQGCFMALSPKWDSFSKIPLHQFFNLSEKWYEPFWRKHFYLLTCWQQWNHRIPFNLKARVQHLLNCLMSWCDIKLPIYTFPALNLIHIMNLSYYLV